MGHDIPALCFIAYGDSKMDLYSMDESMNFKNKANKPEPDIYKMYISGSGLQLFI